MPNKIHYDAANVRCAYAGERTTDRGLVTCKNCLRRMAGNNGAGGRSPRTDGRNKIQIVVSDRAFLVWQSIAKGERSQIVSDWLEKRNISDQ